jgi:hypothetical protein
MTSKNALIDRFLKYIDVMKNDGKNEQCIVKLKIYVNFLGLSVFFPIDL